MTASYFAQQTCLENNVAAVGSDRRTHAGLKQFLDLVHDFLVGWIDVFLPLFTSNNLQLSPKYWDYQAKLQNDGIDLTKWAAEVVRQIRALGSAMALGSASCFTSETPSLG